MDDNINFRTATPLSLDGSKTKWFEQDKLGVTGEMYNIGVDFCGNSKDISINRHYKINRNGTELISEYIVEKKDYYYKMMFLYVTNFDDAVDMCIKHAINKIHKEIDEKVKARNTMRCIEEFGILPIENN